MKAHDAALAPNARQLHKVVKLALLLSCGNGVGFEPGQASVWFVGAAVKQNKEAGGNHR